MVRGRSLSKPMMPLEDKENVNVANQQPRGQSKKRRKRKNKKARKRMGQLMETERGIEKDIADNVLETSHMRDDGFGQGTQVEENIPIVEADVFNAVGEQVEELKHMLAYLTEQTMTKPQAKEENEGLEKEAAMKKHDQVENLVQEGMPQVQSQVPNSLHNEMLQQLEGDKLKTGDMEVELQQPLGEIMQPEQVKRTTYSTVEALQGPLETKEQAESSEAQQQLEEDKLEKRKTGDVEVELQQPLGETMQQVEGTTYSVEEVQGPSEIKGQAGSSETQQQWDEDTLEERKTGESDIQVESHQPLGGKIQPEQVEGTTRSVGEMQGPSEIKEQAESSEAHQQLEEDKLEERKTDEGDIQVELHQPVGGKMEPEQVQGTTRSVEEIQGPLEIKEQVESNPQKVDTLTPGVSFYDWSLILFALGFSFSMQ